MFTLVDKAFATLLCHSRTHFPFFLLTLFNVSTLCYHGHRSNFSNLLTITNTKGNFQNRFSACNVPILKTTFTWS